MMLQRQNDVKGNNPSEYASDVRNQGTKSQLALILGQAPRAKCVHKRGA